MSERMSFMTELYENERMSFIRSRGVIFPKVSDQYQPRPSLNVQNLINFQNLIFVSISCTFEVKRWFYHYSDFIVDNRHI